MSIYFGVVDYIVFAITLIWSVVIGLRFGCFGSKQNSAKEYLYGKRNLEAIPVGLSIYSSMVSAIAILGTPSEIYVFGAQYMLCPIGAFMSMFFIWFIILPVFNGTLDIKTPYEYFELRFNKLVRYISTILYILFTVLLLPLVLFSSCLAVSEATGININICTTVAGGICIFYTLLGGFSTVVWTDAFQATLMLVSCVCIMILGIVRAGGIEEIWTKAENGNRFFFNWDPNPFQRLNIWAVTIGMCFNYMSHMGCPASTLQRYMSLRTEKDARISIGIGIFGFIIVTFVGSITGLSMYAFYQGCDPVKTNVVKGYTQLTTYFALNNLKSIAGLSGLFSAGILSAGLSSLSAEANTLSGIIYYDFIQKKFPKYSSDKKGAFVMKLVVLVFGVYCLLLAPVMAKVKYLIQMTLTLSGSINGAKLSLIILGTTFPKVTTRGALSGITTGFIFICWIAVGATYYDSASFYQLPVSVDNCTQNNSISIYWNFTFPSLSNSINNTVNLTPKEEPFFMYKLSFLFYTCFSTILSIIVALIVSYITGMNDVNKIDPRLLIPFVRPKININNSVQMQKMLNELNLCEFKVNNGMHS